MAPRVVVLGASLGGMVAAAELRKQGCEVTVIEKGSSVGGLYSKAETPFGTQELGMHVLYADRRHYTHLCEMFGEESFHVMLGPNVDKGASANFGAIYFGSHYPCLLNHPQREIILNEILTLSHDQENNASAQNAEEEAIRRFGSVGGREVVIPILRKLWGMEPRNLSRHALHCFFDLRRLIIAPKGEADLLKDTPSLDSVIANPEQDNPKGKVFGGRMGLVFHEACNDLSERATDWASRKGVRIEYGCKVDISEGQLFVNGMLIKKSFDACIVAVPVHMLATEIGPLADRVELSIYYFYLEKSLGDAFPSYYILAHDPHFSASRIVNYDSYRPPGERSGGAVLAVEAIHEPGRPPSTDRIRTEVTELLPSARILETYRLPKSLPVFAPSLKNGRHLDGFESSISESLGKPIYFTGMRTDTGVFFSHHTIGLAYDCALECIRKLS